MNKVILIVLLVCIVSLISSISPPKLPVTFYTNVKIVARFGNVTQNPITGLIANDNAKQLYVFNLKDSHGNSAKTLFNKHAPSIFSVIQLTVHANDGFGLPFFSRYKNFVKYGETDSYIIWKCTTPSDKTRFVQCGVSDDFQIIENWIPRFSTCQ